MGERAWPTQIVLGYLLGMAVAMYVVAWNSTWSAARSILAVAVLSGITTVGVPAAGAIGRGLRGQPRSTRYAVASVGLASVASAAVLASFHYVGDPTWIGRFPAAEGSDGVLWQVQTTFLSVGFAGLAIAAQLFAEAPLAIGASRTRILEYVWAVWFVGVGLFANVLIAVESMWLQSDAGLLVVAVFWFLPTLALLVVSTIRLVRLFGRPSLLDEVVRVALVETLAARLTKVSRMYVEARRQLDDLATMRPSTRDLGPTAVTFRVPVPRAGLVIRAIRPQTVRQAAALLGPRATESGIGDSGTDVLYMAPAVSIDVEPGDRTRLSETAFRVTTSAKLDAALEARLVRLLQSAIDFEPSASVTPYEETDRDIANLKDAVGVNLRAGAYGTAERALELLGEIVRGVWIASSEELDSSRRSAFTRRDWLFRSISEVEQDATLDRRAAGLFVSQAMARALEASRTESTEYVDECLRSFTRLWSDVLRHDGSEVDYLPSRIATCVQNLAAYSSSSWDVQVDLRARATWALVELVKSALDARRPEAARMAARELNNLFEYTDREGGRAHVRAGQLVLSGWLDYLADKTDARDPMDSTLRDLVNPRGTWEQILLARDLAERGAAPFARWDWWEMEPTNAGRAQVLELTHYIDWAELAALAMSRGTLTPARDQETASTYQRFVRLLDEIGRDLTSQESRLRQRLSEEARNWEVAENARLAKEPLSLEKVDAMGAALRESLNSEHRLAAEIRVVEEIGEAADDSRPILGMNFRVPRHYFVDKVFNWTHADPAELGRTIARGLLEGEERRIVQFLRAQQYLLLNPTAAEIHRQIQALGDEASQHVLITPYGGLLDLDEWYSIDFQDALSRVTHIESAALSNEAILFDRRDTLVSYRRPETKEGLNRVEGTSIALGVFEDVVGQREPQVRVETGEVFVIWRGEAPRIQRFASSQADEAEDLGESDNV